MRLHLAIHSGAQGVPRRPLPATVVVVKTLCLVYVQSPVGSKKSTTPPSSPESRMPGRFAPNGTCGRSERKHRY